MARFDALAPYKPAIRNLARAARCDPMLAVTLAHASVTSQKWMMTAAKAEAAGPAVLVRERGLVLVYAKVMSVWLKDDDEGQARTMAALDKELRRGERVLKVADRIGSVFARRRSKPAEPAEAGDPAAEPAAS